MTRLQLPYIAHLTNYKVQSRLEGRNAETDRLLKIVRSDKANIAEWGRDKCNTEQLKRKRLDVNEIGYCDGCVEESRRMM